MRIKSNVKYLFFVLLIGGVSFLYSFTSDRNNAKKIIDTPIEIAENGMRFLSKKTVNKLLIQSGKSVRNVPKSSINLYGLENTFLKSPFIEKATVFLTIDGRLKTNVKQRKPIARIFTKNGSYYIDHQGVKIPLSKNYSARVLLVFGFKNETDLKEIKTLTRYISEDDFLQKEITGINKFDNGEYQFEVRSGNYKINFGNLTKMVVKFKKLKVFYQQTLENKEIKKYASIDLKYNNQVVCKKAK